MEGALIMYTIKIDYLTGGSFGSEETTDEIGPVWSSIEDAKKALNVIKQHYEAYKKINNTFTRTNAAWSDYKNENWFYSKYPDMCLFVDVDNKPHKINSFWCGYFERLIAATVTFSEEEQAAREYRP